MTWPNRITYARLLLVPLFAIVVLQVRAEPAYKYVAVGIFVVIALGDLVDGYLARRLHMVTREGRYIDPITDKILMITTSIFLALPVWAIPSPDWAGRPPLRPEIVIIIVARDFLIVIWVATAFVSQAEMNFRASRLGKATTALQMGMITAMLLGTIWVRVLETVAVPLSYTAAFFTIMSGLHYLYVYGRRISSAGK